MPVFENGGVPQIDFSPLGDLGKTYQDAQNQRTLANLGQGLANGTIDYKTAAGKAAEAGKLDLSLSLLKLGEDKAKETDFNERFRKYFPDAPSDSPGEPQRQPQLYLSNLPTYAPPRPGMIPGGTADGIPVPARAPVASTPRVMGDAEGVRDGYYDAPSAPPAIVGANGPSPLDDAQWPQGPIGKPTQFAQAGGGTQTIPGAQGAIRPATQSAPIGQPSQPAPRSNPLQNNIPALMMLLSHPGGNPGQKKMAEIALTEAIKSPDNLKQYDFYQRQSAARGEQPLPLLDWTIKIKQAGATAITNDMRGENAEAAAMGKAAGERAGETMKSAAAADPPPLKWSDLKYVFWHQGGPKCRGSITSLKRLSRSCGRSMFLFRRARTLPTRSARSA